MAFHCVSSSFKTAHGHECDNYITPLPVGPNLNIKTYVIVKAKHLTWAKLHNIIIVTIYRLDVLSKNTHSVLAIPVVHRSSSPVVQ